MRFDVTKEYKVSDLLLDEGNYRFKAAKDQKECVAKIYFSNPPYFKGLMESIVEDDLGEPLLVYEDNNRNIVLDGNRRLAALKVLSSDEFLPTENLKEYVSKLREGTKVNLARIQAQVSSDKKLVMRTVYERHAGGKTGKARIPWNAYAAARFGFFEEIGDNNEWHFVALLTKTEETNSKITEYIDSNKFSYETFRRLMREAFKRNLISQEIFSGRNKRIKSTADKKLVNDAVEKTLKILDAMEKREISLSRGDSFADQKTVEKFFDSFTLSPDAQRVENAKNSATQSRVHEEGSTSSAHGNSSISDNQSNASQRGQSGDNGTSGQSAANDENDAGNGRQPNNGITKSDEIEKRLKELNSVKLSGLLHSIAHCSSTAYVCWRVELSGMHVRSHGKKRYSIQIILGWQDEFLELG
ncbi:MAG: hypothetical protein H6862_01590 [Rhodospirillales bacterium]|nr:hypothetical protein [Rhodospirillales bacterium]